jgi:DNA-binding NtrC family response regulator
MRRLEEIECEAIRMAIDHYDGHMSEIARRLGIGRSTLYRKLKEFGLDQPGQFDVMEEEPSRHAAM